MIIDTALGDALRTCDLFFRALCPGRANPTDTHWYRFVSATFKSLEKGLHGISQN